MEPIEISRSEALIYSMLLNAAFGFAVGVIPLIVGIVKRKVKLGVYGLIASAVGGALLGFILSIPAMAIFTWMIIRDQIRPDEPAEIQTPEDN